MQTKRRNSISGGNQSALNRRRSSKTDQKNRRRSINLTNNNGNGKPKSLAKLTSRSLKMRLGGKPFNGLKSDILSTKSINPNGHTATFWNSDNGPGLFIDKMANTGQGILREIRDDIDQIKRDSDIFKESPNGLPKDIYIIPSQGADMANITQNINNQLTPPNDKTYLTLNDGTDGNPIHLSLVDLPPQVVNQQQNQADDDDVANLQPPLPPLPPQQQQNQAAPAQQAPNLQLQANRPVPMQPARIRPIPPSTVMDVDRFKQTMRRDPADDDTIRGRVIKERDKIYKEINRQLVGYKNALDTTLAKPDTIAPDTLDADNQNLQQLKDDLILQAQSFLDKHKFGNPVEQAAVVALVAALTKDNLKGYNEALAIKKANTESIQDFRERQQLVQQFAPLQNHNIDRSQVGRVLGQGAQGEVRSLFVTLPDGRTIEAARKFDNKEASDAAGGIGIPKDKPDEAKRSVATYEASKFLGLNIVPPTFLYYGVNPKTNQDEVGQLMESVNGTDGTKKFQLAKITDPAEINNRLQLKAKYENDPKSLTMREPATFQNTIYRDNNGIIEVYDAETRPLDIDYTSPIVQKDLADQQLLDIFVGHADRHGGNWRYVLDNQGKVVGVRALDNDDTWGSTWKGMVGRWDNSKTPGDPPPIVDIQSAINILKVNPDNLPDSITNKISPGEVDAAKDRLRDLQTKIKDRVINGRIAKMKDAKVSQQDIQFLQQAVGPQNNVDMENLKEWGLIDTFVFFVPKKGQDGGPPPINNSYLAETLALKSARGVAPV